MAAGPVKDGALENLNSLLEDYGVTVADGIVVEGDREHYALQTPHALIPELADHEITASLAEARYFPIIPISSGLEVSEEAKESGRVTELLTDIGAGVQQESRLRAGDVSKGRRGHGRPLCVGSRSGLRE